MSDLIRQEFLNTDNDAIMKEIEHCLEFDSIATLPWGSLMEVMLASMSCAIVQDLSCIYLASLKEPPP